MVTHPCDSVATACNLIGTTRTPEVNDLNTLFTKLFLSTCMPVRGNEPGYEAKKPLDWNSILIPKSTTSPSGLAENFKNSKRVLRL